MTSLDKLVGESNWITWKFHIQLILEEKELWDLVTDGLELEETAVDKKNVATRKKDATAKRLIGMSVGESAAIHILACKSAKEMWEALHEVYELKNEMSILALNEKFLSARKEQDENMSSYVARVQEMARKLALFNNPVPDQMLMANILRGLGKQYQHFATSWESAPISERTLGNLKARLMIEEDRLDLKGSEETGLALAATKQKLPSSDGHEQEDDRDWKKKVKCFFCKKTGHIRRDCKFRDRGYESGALIAHSHNGQSGEKWIADSGATDHMCNDKSVFESLKNCQKAITVANGATIMTTGRGTVRIKCFDGKTWRERVMVDVLLVPELAYNLFSVTKAMDKGYRFTSSARECKITNGANTIVIGTRDAGWFTMKVETVRNVVIRRPEKQLIGMAEEPAPAVSTEGGNKRELSDSEGDVKQVDSEIPAPRESLCSVTEGSVCANKLRSGRALALLAISEPYGNAKRDDEQREQCQITMADEMEQLVDYRWTNKFVGELRKAGLFWCMDPVLYAKKIIERYRMTEDHPVSTPCGYINNNSALKLKKEKQRVVVSYEKADHHTVVPRMDSCHRYKLQKGRGSGQAGPCGRRLQPGCDRDKGGLELGGRQLRARSVHVPRRPPGKGDATLSTGAIAGPGPHQGEAGVDVGEKVARTDEARVATGRPLQRRAEDVRGVRVGLRAGADVTEDGRGTPVDAQGQYQPGAVETQGLLKDPESEQAGRRGGDQEGVQEVGDDAPPGSALACLRG